MSPIKTLGGFLLLTLVGCGGGGGMGPDDSEGPGAPGGGGTVARVIKSNPSFATDIQEIFTRKGCAAGSCHGTSAQAGLTLTSGAAYADLVNVTATQSALLRVAPGDPSNSYLVMKVEGTASFGGRMPLGGTALDNIDLTNIRNWISSGAPNN